MPMRARGTVIFIACALLTACSSSETVQEVELDASSADTSQSDTSAPDAPPETSADTSTLDTAEAAIDTAKPDVQSTFDAAPGDVGGTFACGVSTCSKSLQFCRKATSPGICPMLGDTGPCPAGCPGCPALGVSCDNLPMECWAAPSCGCILTKICGSTANGTCTETSGGFTAGCNGI